MQLGRLHLRPIQSAVSAKKSLHTLCCWCRRRGAKSSVWSRCRRLMMLSHHRQPLHSIVVDNAPAGRRNSAFLSFFSVGNLVYLCCRWKQQQKGGRGAAAADWPRAAHRRRSRPIRAISGPSGSRVTWRVTSRPPYLECHFERCYRRADKSTADFSEKVKWPKWF